jgi:4-diphosphocytidyl-2-C-methyl-D-erythritol kinase
MRANDVISLPAPAKINLYLHVTGRRPDGYHTLDSLVVFAEAGDRVEIRKAEGRGPSVTVSGPFAEALAAVPGGACGNLVLRAARLMGEAADRAPNVAIALEKNLPLAAGIGGGSSDAASTLLALDRLWGLNWSPQRLADLGLRLGADVPACLACRPVFVGGIGEQVCAAPALPPLWAVLANPLRPVATPKVFAALNGPYSHDACWGRDVHDAVALEELLATRRNDLQDAAISLEPDIARVLDALAVLPGAFVARMSGSGATCFALFDNAEASQTAAQRLRRTQPGWWVLATRLMTGSD